MSNLHVTRHYGEAPLDTTPFDLAIDGLEREWEGKRGQDARALAALAVHVRRLNWAVLALAVCVLGLMVKLAIK